MGVAAIQQPRTPQHVRKARMAATLLKSSGRIREHTRLMGMNRLFIDLADTTQVGRNLFRWTPQSVEQPHAVELEPEPAGGESVTVAPVRQLQIVTASSSPAVFRVEGFASAEECRRLIELSRPRLGRSMELNDKGEREKRTSDSAVGLNFMLHDPTVRSVMQRAAKLLNVTGAEISDFDMQLVRYSPGQHYTFHDDAAAGTIERFVTMLLYLNPGQQNCGGHTQGGGGGGFCGGETVLPMARPTSADGAVIDHGGRHCTEACDTVAARPAAAEAVAAACSRCLHAVEQEVRT